MTTVSNDTILTKHATGTTDQITTLSEKIKAFFTEADRTNNIQEKKGIYETAFQSIVKEARKGTLENTLQLQFFTLLEAYAGKCCYGQASKEDPEQGFRQSARLMELSLGLQLVHLGLTKAFINWQEVESLDKLLSLKGFEKFEKWSFLPETEYLLTCDGKALAELASNKGISEQLTTTLIRLSFSFQNIESTKKTQSEDCILLHSKLQAITEKCIGDVVLDQLKRLEDFRYNRCVFMASLQAPNDWKAQIKSYDSVLELSEKVYVQDPLELKSRKAQIANMRGIILLKSGLPDAANQAEPFTKEAFKLRQELIGKFATEKQNWSQRFLLANIRTSLVQIASLTANRSKELATQAVLQGNKEEALRQFKILQSKKQEVLEHAEALTAYLKELDSEGNNHSYRQSYEIAIMAAFAALLL